MEELLCLSAGRVKGPRLGRALRLWNHFRGGMMTTTFRWLACLALCSTLCVGASAQANNWPKIKQHYQKGEQALQAKRYAEAAEEFRKILTLDPNNASAHANLGFVAFSEGHFDQASQEFRIALKLNPQLWNAWALLGMSEFRRGNDTPARTYLEKSFPHMKNSRLKTDAGMDMIRLYYKTEEFSRCLEVLRSLPTAQQKSPQVLFLEYRIYSDLAARSLKTLIADAPNSAEMHEAAAQALANRNDFAGAIAQYRKALEIDPQLPQVHFELGIAIMSRAQTPEALAAAEHEFSTCLQLDPTNAHSEYMLGEIASLRSKPEEALHRYIQALHFEPNFVKAHIAAGKALTKLGRPKNAIAQLLEAVRLDPRSQDAHYRLAHLYRQLGRPEDARREEKTFQKLRDQQKSVSALFQQVEGQSSTHPSVTPGKPQ